MKPVATLFMLMSVDGKISTGAADELDFDKDLPRIEGVKESLQQYYDMEQTTDLWSMNSGRVQAKLGVNESAMSAKALGSFVLIDNHRLKEHGMRYFCARSEQLVIVTSNREHPALQVNEPNCTSSIKISWICTICWSSFTKSLAVSGSRCRQAGR